MISIKSLLVLIVVLIVTQKPIGAVDYLVYDRTTSPGSSRYRNEIGEPYTLQTLRSASEFILNFFDDDHDDDEHINGEKDYDEVIVTVEEFASGSPPVSATTTGSNIRLNSNYIQTYPGKDVRSEFTGIMYRESTHVWQWTGRGQAPVGLTNGIADYVRLIAGWPSESWSNVTRGSGSRWNDGNIITAYFLEYCSTLRSRFVSELNDMMEDHYDDLFFTQLLGRTVDELWNAYKAVHHVPAPSRKRLS